MTEPALRIALVVPRFAPYHGGAETWAAKHAAALAANGAHVTVVTQAPRSAGLVARVAQDGYTIERHHLPIGDIFDVPSPGAARAARRSRRFDIVWAHNYHSPLAWLAAEKAKMPVVLTPHYHGVGHTPLRQVLHGAYRPAGRRLVATSRRIVVDSEAEADLILRDFSGQVQRDKIDVVPLAVADPVAGRPPFPSSTPIVLTIARQEPYKRTDLLIRAIVEVRNRGVPARLVVVGEGSGAAAYRELAVALGAEDIVTFTGAVDDETLRRWWASASLYATASSHEAYGVGLAEALTAGLPVVASGIAAHREVVRRAGSRALARLCDIEYADAPSRYADAIADLLSSAEPREQRAARCTLPSAAAMAEQLLETLRAARS